MARKTMKKPDEDRTRTAGQGTPHGQQPAIPKARRLGGNTYVMTAPVSTTRKPIPKTHRKTKTS
jgi:hypothetical protein